MTSVRFSAENGAALFIVIFRSGGLCRNGSEGFVLYFRVGVRLWDFLVCKRRLEESKIKKMEMMLGSANDDVGKA
jgi:hypothetical protein